MACEGCREAVGRWRGRAGDHTQRSRSVRNVPPPPLAPPARPRPCSRRADPLAAWTNSLDLSAVVADTDRAFLILETGFNQRWRYGAYRRSVESTAEAQAWEETKKAVG